MISTNALHCLLFLSDFALVISSFIVDSRGKAESVCLLPIPLAFYGSMLNVLSDMVGVWAGLGGGEGARGCGGVIQAVQIQPLALR